MTFSPPTVVGPAYAPAVSSPLHRYDPMANNVIDRCTRNGHVAWQAVAMMLGRCAHSVRSDYDPTYLKPQDSEKTA